MGILAANRRQKAPRSPRSPRVWNLGPSGRAKTCHNFNNGRYLSPNAPWCWYIYLHDWVIFRVNVGRKIQHHGACGHDIAINWFCHCVPFKSQRISQWPSAEKSQWLHPEVAVLVTFKAPPAPSLGKPWDWGYLICRFTQQSQEILPMINGHLFKIHRHCLEAILRRYSQYNCIYIYVYT